MPEINLKWRESTQWHYDGKATVERLVWWAHWNWDEVFDEKDRMIGHQAMIVETVKGKAYSLMIRITRDGKETGGQYRMIEFDFLDAAQRHVEVWLSDDRRYADLKLRYLKRRETGGKPAKNPPNEKWKALRF